ncbi:Uncharacterised protein [Oligella urethralis]|uniref:hypothetical protein n=1 Tax=Oligella urethralis TaxID=90245 RepID=UPI000DF8AE15|nr:hypothetical protein [Oligella urethralis]SUA54910.1 Uncharacterised protein [Oligella urethralis]SUA94403.1 Uncharacterised protein [Oligella urethralis]
MIDWNRDSGERVYGLKQLAYPLFTLTSGFYVWVFNKVFKEITKMHYYIVLILVGLTIYLGLLVFAWLFFFDLEEFDYSGAFFFWLAIMIFGRRYLPIWVEECAKEVGDDRTVKDKCGPADDAK